MIFLQDVDHVQSHIATQVNCAVVRAAVRQRDKSDVDLAQYSARSCRIKQIYMTIVNSLVINALFHRLQSASVGVNHGNRFDGVSVEQRTDDSLPNFASSQDTTPHESTSIVGHNRLGRSDAACGVSGRPGARAVA